MAQIVAGHGTTVGQLVDGNHETCWEKRCQIKTTAYVSEPLNRFGGFMNVDGDLAVQQFLLLKH